MADELRITIVATLENGNLKTSFAPGQVAIDQTTAGLHAPVAVVGTVEEVLSVGDVATLGYAFFRNLDTTNFVTLGPESGGAMVGLLKLKPGEAAAVRLLPGITLRAKADTAAVRLQMILLED